MEEDKSVGREMSLESAAEMVMAGPRKEAGQKWVREGWSGEERKEREGGMGGYETNFLPTCPLCCVFYGLQID